MIAYQYVAVWVGGLFLWWLWRWGTKGVTISYAFFMIAWHKKGTLQKIAAVMDEPAMYDMYQEIGNSKPSYHDYLQAVTQQKDAALQQHVHESKYALKLHGRYFYRLGWPIMLVFIGALPYLMAGMLLYGVLNMMHFYIFMVRRNEPLLTMRLLIDRALSLHENRLTGAQKLTEAS